MPGTNDTRPWYSSYDAEVSPRIPYESIPIFEYLDRSAEAHPKRRAITFNNYKISYAKLKKLAEVMAANLADHGLMPGDRVSVMLPNLPQTIIAYWAILKAGGTVVMTNPLYMEKEIIHQVNDSGSRFLIALDLVWPKLAPLRDRLGLEKMFFTRVSDGLKFPLNILQRWQAKKTTPPPQIPFDNETILPWKALSKGKATYSYTSVRPESDLALLQYTGGTTGVPKGCMITHANLSANVAQCMHMLHTIGAQREVFLGVLPYFHIYGLTTCLNFPTALAAELVPFPRFTPLQVLKAVGKVKPTIFPGAPSIYIALLHQKEAASTDFSSMRYCISGSAPMPVDIMKQFKEITGAEIIEGYGLSEASPVTHLNPLRRPGKPGSIGLPFPDTDARIVDLEVGGPYLPPGKMGELIVKGPQVMKGYWERPDETASALRNGWLYTGDIATMDEEGFFYIVDRKKDLIISGGYNIYPREIDEVLYEHPKVKEAVVVGIPHRTRGEVVKAFIVPRDGESLDKTDIVSFCKTKLANFKVPRQVEFRDELPKTLVGKVLRRALRDEEIARQQKKQDQGRT